jgi:hypothetical protein
VIARAIVRPNRTPQLDELRQISGRRTDRSNSFAERGRRHDCARVCILSQCPGSEVVVLEGRLSSQNARAGPPEGVRSPGSFQTPNFRSCDVFFGGSVPLRYGSRTLV